MYSEGKGNESSIFKTYMDNQIIGKEMFFFLIVFRIINEETKN